MIERWKGLVLDPFQSEALEAIGRGESVVVAAPTGAGKTVIAEFAIAKALKEGRRVVYTAPIKALSNQKFRDFSAIYPGEIGITTGDVSINPHARAVIMTTEIFRNTIFDDPRRLEDVGTVIYDEIHYMDDPERGTVWEESLIFAPPEIKVVALSATISNLDEFADWLREVRGGTVRVVLEEKRPVPLEIFVAAEKGGIRPWQHARSLKVHDRDRERRRGRRHDRHDRSPEERQKNMARSHRSLVRALARQRELPCLFFLFSRDWCERVATACLEDDYFQGDASRRRAAQDELDRLVDAYGLDRGDPEVSRLRNLVSKGIAFHHAGLLPALKEVVEQLFSEHHVRVLFATETFALGVNFPARSVAFEGLRKWNGVARVLLKTREFQQMAGRAGRRGIDTRGDVFISWDPERDDPHVLKTIVSGKVEAIESQFNLSYSTVLNLYQRLGDKIYSACARSFANFRLKKRLERGETQRPHDDGPLRDDEIAAAGGRNAPPRRGRVPGLNEPFPRRRKGRPGRREREARREQQPHDRGLRHAEQRDRGGRGQGQRDGRWQGGRGQAPPPRPIGAGRYEDMVEQVRKKLDLLRDLDYVEGRELTPKGQFAASVYGHELEATELVYEGVLDRLSPAQIAVVATAVVHESRREEATTGGIDPRRALGDAWRQANRVVRNVYDREVDLGIRTPVRLLDWKLTGAAWDWCHGAEFAKLRELTDASDGDLVRSFRQAIQLLRLLQEPLGRLLRETGPRQDLHTRVGQAVRLMKRGLVDAEWQIKRAAEIEAERLRELERGITHDAPQDVEPPVAGEDVAAHVDDDAGPVDDIAGHVDDDAGEDDDAEDAPDDGTEPGAHDDRDAGDDDEDDVPPGDDAGEDADAGGDDEDEPPA